MAKKIATQAQLDFLEVFKEDKKLCDFFYLTGGTALSIFYLQHRVSDDLDFFSRDKFSLNIVEGFVKKTATKLRAKRTHYSKLFDRHIYVFDLPQERSLKFEFTYFEHQPLKKPVLKDGILVDNLEDLGANKLFCIFDRNEPKDYIDLFFIHQYGLKLEKLRKLAEKKFQVIIDPITLGSLLSRGKNIIFPPKKLLKSDLIEIQNFFSSESKKLKGDIFF